MAHGDRLIGLNALNARDVGGFVLSNKNPKGEVDLF